MSKFVDAIRSEPVRVYLYGLAVAVVAALVWFGVVSGGAVPVLMAVILAALALPSPIESARSMVTPVANLSPPPEVSTRPNDGP